MPYPLPRLLRRVCAISLPLLLGLSGCVDKFAPDVIAAPNSFLVVDGFINLRGVTTIRLAHTQNLTATAAPPAETGATAYVQDDQGQRYPLAEAEPGVYLSGTLSLSTTRRYQVQVRTSAGREYASDLVTGKLTPPIDKVSFALAPRGVQVYVNAHDPAGATHYYRWKFEETWQINSAYQSDLVYDAVAGVVRHRDEDIHICWRTETAKIINLSSTEKLSQDVVADFPLTVLPTTSEKLRIKYSILVQQYAQTPEEYAYWENLKKNTESLGGLFDAQPTQLTGNVHCLTDAAEPVIGYVGAESVTERRIFIAAGIDLPLVRSETGYEFCPPTEIEFVKDFPPKGLLIEPLGIPVPIAYSTALAECADCRLRGTNKKPSFWP